MHLDAILVVPLDDAANLVAGVEDHHHRRSRLHLLDVIKIFGVRLLRRSGLATLHPSSHLILDFR